MPPTAAKPAKALTAEQVAEILERSAAGAGRAELAAAFGVSVYTIDSVRRGRTKGADPSKGRALSIEQARSIRERNAAGETQTSLAAEFGTSQQVISQIVRGLSYREAEA